MKPGIVVNIRVNPRDCMTVADLASRDKLAVEGMSFSSAVSLVFSALCQAAREMGAAPERSGFEFSEMMKMFSGTDRQRKLDITNAVTNAGSEFKVRAINMPLGSAIKRFNEGTAKPARTPAQLKAEAKMRELFAQREAAPDSWNEASERELERTIAIAAGDLVPPEG